MITQKAKDALRSSQKLQGMIADTFKRTTYSVQRWIDEDESENGMLSTRLQWELSLKKRV